MASKCICSNDLTRRMLVKRLKATATIDASGHIDETLDSNWESVGYEWCQIITSGSREFVVGDQLLQQISHQITIRFSATAETYTAGMKLVWNNRTFSIAGSPQNVNEQDQWIRFPAIEVTTV